MLLAVEWSPETLSERVFEITNEGIKVIETGKPLSTKEVVPGNAECNSNCEFAEQDDGY